MPATFKAASVTAEDGAEVWIIQVPPESVTTSELRQSLPQGMSKVFPHRFVLVAEESNEVRVIGRDEDVQAFRASAYPDLPWQDITVPLLTELR
jgi:hypothetical protein